MLMLDKLHADGTLELVLLKLVKQHHALIGIDQELVAFGDQRRY